MSLSLLFNDSLHDFKRSLASKLMTGFAIIVCVGLPLSLFRWLEVGFQPVFLLHTAITSIVLACKLRPDKSNYTLDFVVVVVGLLLLIFAGVFSFGLQSGVISLATFVSFLVAVLWGIRPAIYFTVFWCVFFLGVGFLFVNEQIEYSVKPEIYSATLGSWVLVAVGSTLSITFILILASQVFMELSKQLGIIGAQKKEIEYLANHDSLTGYYSSRLAMPMLKNALSTAKRSAHKVAVVFVDLNKFKLINDTFGHEVGDDVLASIAKMFKEEIRDMDIAIRIGGDEFLFVLPGLQSSSDALEIVTRLIGRLSEYISVGGHELTVSASAGIAIYPDDSLNASMLRNYADKAMYSAKESSLRIMFFNDVKEASDAVLSVGN